jgi:hypothetical protein
MVKIARKLLMIVTLSLLALSLSGQGGPPDLSGTWDLQSTFFLPTGLGGMGTCTFQGSADVGQNGTTLSGDATQSLVDGGTACPAEMDGTLTGEVSGNQVSMGMVMGGDLGESDFIGTLAANLALQGGGNTVSGTTTVTSGPFAGATGTFDAVQGTVPVVEVPASSTVGLVVLVAILLVVGGLLLRRRSPARSAP